MRGSWLESRGLEQSRGRSCVSRGADAGPGRGLPVHLRPDGQGRNLLHQPGQARQAVRDHPKTRSRFGRLADRKGPAREGIYGRQIVQIHGGGVSPERHRGVTSETHVSSTTSSNTSFRSGRRPRRGPSPAETTPTERYEPPTDGMSFAEWKARLA